VLRLYDHWRLRLANFLRQAAPHVVCSYGGIKCPHETRSRIAVWKRSPFRNPADLDLWDAARFRVIVPSLQAMSELVTWLLEEMRYQMVRCRNYYWWPRNGSLDPYRAIHFEFQTDSEDFVELQVVSARREAVGLTDHALVHKRRFPFFGRLHELWLRQLSWSANLLDAFDISTSNDSDLLTNLRGLNRSALNVRWNPAFAA
jgi:hypothetical protein